MKNQAKVCHPQEQAGRSGPWPGGLLSVWVGPLRLTMLPVLAIATAGAVQFPFRAWPVLAGRGVPRQEHLISAKGCLWCWFCGHGPSPPACLPSRPHLNSAASRADLPPAADLSRLPQHSKVAQLHYPQNPRAVAALIAWLSGFPTFLATGASRAQGLPDLLGWAPAARTSRKAPAPPRGPGKGQQVVARSAVPGRALGMRQARRRGLQHGLKKHGRA